MTQQFDGSRYYEEELAFVEKHWPGYIAEFYQLLLKGKVDSHFYFNPGWQCGCFYGWLQELHKDVEHPEIEVLQKLYDETLNDERETTDLERLLANISRGDTPQTNETAAYLEQLLQPYLSIQER